MFQNPKEYIETHGLDTPPYEHFTGCPMCGGSYVPYKQCNLCGNPIFDEYIMLKSGEVYCENCYCRKNIDDLCRMQIADLYNFFANINLSVEKMQIGKLAIKEIMDRLKFLIDVGLDYLTLHSLNVYDALKELVKQFQEIEVSEESIAIAALFHDLCKANYYAVGTKNVKDELTGQWHKEPFYKAEDQFPVGHGEKSVIILLQYMKLTDEEIYAIRWHMSGFDSAVKGGDFGCSKAYDMCPFAVLLHLADMEATYLMEERSV